MERSEKSCCKAAIHDPKGQIIKTYQIITAPPATHRRGALRAPAAPPSNPMFIELFDHPKNCVAPIKASPEGRGKLSAELTEEECGRKCWVFASA